jgi:alpha-mannosidase
MSVLRTPIYAFHDPRKVNPKETYQYPDLGRSSFRYSLIPHGGDWRAVVAPRAGEEFNTPLAAFIEPFHNGALKSGEAFLEVGPDNVVGMILKRSQAYANGDVEDSRLIVRLYEGHGLDGTATVRLPKLGIDAKVAIGHHEIKTLAFDLANPTAPPVTIDLLERPM